MNKKGRIYGIVDIVKNKIVYIGKTINLNDYTPHGKKIKKIIFKNPSRYYYKIIEENIDERFLDNKEKKYIKLYGTYQDKNCFNYTEGGGGGDTFSKQPYSKKIEINNKRANKLKLIFESTGFREKMLPIWKKIGQNSKLKLTGRKLTEAHKNKIKEGMLKALKDPTKRKNISHIGIKKPKRTLKHKKNISLAMKGKKKSEEHKLKIKLRQQGRKKITDGKRRSWLFANQNMPEGWRYI